MSLQNIVKNEGSPLLPVNSFNSERKKSNKNLYLATFAACLGAFSMGCALGYSSPVGPQLTNQALIKPQLVISDNAKSWFDGVVSIGALLGGFIGGSIVGYLGYQTSLILTALPYIIGWLFITYSYNLALLLFGRFFSGISIGMTSLIVPVYISEISPSSLRGPLGTCFQLINVIGVLFSFLVGSLTSWQWLATICAFFPIGMLIMMIFMPEAPRWLIRNSRRDDAISALSWIRNTSEEEAETESCELEKFLGEEEKMTFKELWQPSLYKPILITTFAMIFQQFSGINAVIFNTNSIFIGAMPSFDPKLASVLIGLTQVFATLLSVFLIDRLGRKILLLASGGVMCVMCILFGIYYYSFKVNDQATWLPLFCIIVYIIAFSCGYGPIPWLLMAELIPGRAKGIASGIAVMTNWISVFLITKEFKDMQRDLHDYGTFWFFGITCFIGVLFVYKYVPETKGKTLEEMTMFFEAKNIHVSSVI